MDLQKDGRSWKGSPYCKRGHLKEFGKDCRECNRLRCAAFAESHREEQRQAAKQWHRDNREYHLDYMREYQQRNRVRLNKSQKEWKHRNIEHVREQSRKAYAAHPERQAANGKRWKENNREVWREINSAQKSRRRARLKGNFGSHTGGEWGAILAKFKHRCAHCGCDGKLEKDHIVPVALGGSDMAVNLQPLCRKCNGSKSATIAEGTQLGIFDKVGQ